MTENKKELSVTNPEVFEKKTDVAEDDGLDTEFPLSRPVTFEGVVYEKLDLDFEKLTGMDIEKAEAQFNAEDQNNQVTMVKEMSKGFAAIVASKAAGVNVALIRALSGSDYSKITMRTTLFLMAGK